MNDTVKYELSDGVATLTLNRPEALNALNGDMVAALEDLVPRIETDANARCLVLRGAGDHFMAGGDLKQFQRELDQPPEAIKRGFEDLLGRFHMVVRSLRRMPKPVLASVRGAAAGGGFSLMLAADLAIAAEDAYFTLAYCLIGASPDGGSTHHLPRIVGLRKAMELALLGERFDAAAAARLGVVNWVVPAEDLDAETARVARRLAQGSAEALGRTKQLLVRSFETPLDGQLSAEADSFADCAAAPDFAEGIAAFIEKRPARFGGV
jgi:2-(1,2-epoxy-1,2-dihydrophenyl)acetyl-CoA isomerase